MDLKSKLNEIFNEARDFGSSRETSLGSRKGFNKHTESLEAGARRKRKERMLEKRKREMLKQNEKSIKETGNPIHHPREFLDEDPIKLTLLETFVHNLIKHTKDGKKEYLRDAIKLMEEYPKLYEYVTKTSRQNFKNEMSVYSPRIYLDEEVGHVIKRPEGLRLCYLSIPDLEKQYDEDEYMILEAKISPDKILIHIPAFTKLMEKLILSGKIEENQDINVLRKAKYENRVICCPSVNEGVVIKINK